jgi:hypothetical protein
MQTHSTPPHALQTSIWPAPATLFPISLLLDPVGQQAGDARYVFEAKTIQRMELLVLSTLKWRMQAVTPLSYVDYFLHRLRGGAAPSRRAVLRSAELILCIARGEQRPGSSQFSPGGGFFFLLMQNHTGAFRSDRSDGVAATNAWQGRTAWISGPRRSPWPSPPSWPAKSAPWTSSTGPSPTVYIRYTRVPASADVLASFVVGFDRLASFINAAQCSPLAFTACNASKP